MRNEGVKNHAASVRARLLSLSREKKTEFQTILTRFALERLLWRLSISAHSHRFLLKGAMLFSLWMDEPHRPTRDLDLLGVGDPSVSSREEIFRHLCSIPAPEDGLVFDADSVTASAIREDNLYGGVRVLMTARLDTALIPLQIDVGFGDSIVPEPEEVTYPTLLNLPGLPAPELRAYRRETVVAEKFEAMVSLGIANSRMKDFYDLYSLAQNFDFYGDELLDAIRATFSRRGTTLPIGSAPLALTPEFSQSTEKQQWSAFARRLGKNAAVGDLMSVVDGIAAFLLPLFESSHVEASSSITPRLFWQAGGPWDEYTPQA